MQVLGRGGAAVVIPVDPGVAEPAQVDGEDAVPPGEQRDEPAEGPPGLGEAVDKQDRRSRQAGGDVVELGAVDFGGVVRDAAKRARVVEEVNDAARALGLEVVNVIESPIAGAEGNIEFLALYRVL